MTTATATPETTVDPLDAAMAAEALPSDRTYFAEVTTVDAWHCVLEKGAGKVQFDSSKHSITQQRTAIKIVAVPVQGQYDITQDGLATDKAWLNFTRPSIQKLGLNLRDLRGTFVRLKKVPSGESYTNAKGEKKEKTAIVFEEVYADRAACQAAADAYWAARKGESAESASQEAAPAAQEPGNDQERAFALQALEVMWKSAKGNHEAFYAQLDANPMISKYFSRTSPEVAGVMGLPF